MEFWDLLDENRAPLGRKIARQDKETMGPREYHLVAEVWTCDWQGRVLVTQRDPAKDFPLQWENTGGSVLAGEDSLYGALRELREETGLMARPRDLTLFFSRRERRAFVDSYLFRTDSQSAHLEMQAGETVDYRWITLEQLDELHREGLLALPQADRLLVYRDLLYGLIAQGAAAHTTP